MKLNQANVNALAAAFAGAFFAVQGGALTPEECQEVAEHMITSKGVLVPSSVTDKQWGSLCDEGRPSWDGAFDPFEGPGMMRTEAERIAREGDKTGT